MSKKHKHSNSNSKHNRFFHEYNYEITVVFLLITGIFLLLEKMKIKQYLFDLIVSIVVFVSDMFLRVIDVLSGWIRNIEGSDIVGYLLIAIAVIMVLAKVRSRFIRRYSYITNCPKCDYNLHRTHKLIKHRFLELLLIHKVENYSCKKCDFSGIQLRLYN